MRRGVGAILLLLAFLLLHLPPQVAPSEASDGPASDPPADTAFDSRCRTFHLDWVISVHPVPPAAREAMIWIAIPQELREQQVEGLTIRSDDPWEVVEDSLFHNRVVRVTVEDPPDSIGIEVEATVERKPVLAPIPADLTEEARRLFLREEALVSLSPRVRSLADSLENTPRARYDYVLGLMDYDKSVPGWGLGDTERACDVRRGNCTDFHSLYLSLSRARQVPAFFEMGYPMSDRGESNRIGGYHCWAWFYDSRAGGWVPVDISEADKHPEKAEFFFGHLDADRVSFSRGREIRLPGMKGEALNFLPPGAYVEVDGVALRAGVTRRLSYEPIRR